MLTLRKILFAGFAIYIVITCYTTYTLVTKVHESTENGPKPKSSSKGNKQSHHQIDEEWNPWGDELFKKGENKVEVVKPKFKWSNSNKLDFGKKFNKNNDSNGVYDVEVWGKAAIGLYFWQHIMEGMLESKMNGVWHYGFQKNRNIKFKFRTGPGVIPSKAPIDTKYLILIVNGRIQDKVDFAQLWLDHLKEMPYLQKVAVIMLGNEQCDNDWFVPYTRQYGGPVDQLFITYDSPAINHINIHPWPLGVATYRGFSLVQANLPDVLQPRPFVCNFLGTVYINSSRQSLMNILEDNSFQDKCFIKARKVWEPNENDQTRQQYEFALSQSDLTLCPVGVNSECYRIYEACAYGSIPVIEDIMTPGRCGNSTSCQNSPLCFLKSMRAPFIFIKDWKELTGILQTESKMTQREKIERRKTLVEWYRDFRSNVKEDFLNILQKSFFTEVVT
ncbi:ribitol-5-phosphate xylosyltransferase 1-like [Glandiceps talaboti]